MRRLVKCRIAQEGSKWYGLMNVGGQFVNDDVWVTFSVTLSVPQRSEYAAHRNTKQKDWKEAGKESSNHQYGRRVKEVAVSFASSREHGKRGVWVTSHRPEPP